MGRAGGAPGRTDLEMSKGYESLSKSVLLHDLRGIYPEDLVHNHRCHMGTGTLLHIHFLSHDTFHDFRSVLKYSTEFINLSNCLFQDMETIFWQNFLSILGNTRHI